MISKLRNRKNKTINKNEIGSMCMCHTNNIPYLGIGGLESSDESVKVFTTRS